MVGIPRHRLLNGLDLLVEPIVLLLVSSAPKQINQVFHKSIDAEHSFC